MTIPTAAELDILSVLWTLGTATVREVHDELGNDNRYTTTLKTHAIDDRKAPSYPHRARRIPRLRG